MSPNRYRCIELDGLFFLLNPDVMPTLNNVNQTYFHFGPGNREVQKTEIGLAAETQTSNCGLFRGVCAGAGGGGSP